MEDSPSRPPLTPMEDSSSPRADGVVRVKKSMSFLAKVGNMVASQAVPLVIGLVSLVIAVDAWWSARAVEFEQDRALASLEMRSRTFPMADGGCDVVTRLRVTNVGLLTFAVLDLRLEMETDEGLVADWDDNSLLGSRGTALPIGFQPLARVAPPDPQHAMLRFAEGERTWHVIDPGRTVDLTFVQPTRGSGRLSMGVELFTQPLMLEDVASAITVQERVRGEMLPASPESGEGQVSDQPLYPYSAGDVLVIPPGCWTDFGGDPRPSVSPPAARPAAP